MILLCTKCRTWQVAIREEQPDPQVVLDAIDHIRCPICDSAPSAEYLAEIKDLIRDCQQLRARYQAMTQRFAHESWSPESPI